MLVCLVFVVVNCDKGKAKEYTWNDAVKRFKNVEYVGYSDWRMPTVDELKTLVYCSNGRKTKDDSRCNDGADRPTINQQAFPNTPSSSVWSGSPVAYGTNYAWFVNFDNGISGYGFRYGDRYVRLVRGGQ
ncbi:MAG: DUF1566 domain-containing protein [Candidatus Electrothrix sp. AR3]|nr:DUF1566 domain-containing protein [Candidatus Electrothrix sp. AR3]